MDDLEDGELPSSPEDGDTVGGSGKDEECGASYNPLPRPEGTRPKTSTSVIPQTSGGGGGQSSYMQRNVQSSDDDGSSSASDYDSDDPFSKGPGGKRKMLRLKSADQEMTPAAATAPPGGHNSKFASMARDFQNARQRKGQNNVWGSILQEDALNTEMQSSLGVGRKSLRELDSDRGAETYDFSLAAEVKAKEEAAALEGQKKDLDQDLDQYFTSKGSQETTPTEMENAGLPERFVGGEDRRQPKDAIRAGVKRSVKDRLGSRREQKEFQHKGQDSFDPEMSIPPPGVPREIPDLTDEFLKELGKPENNTRGRSATKESGESDEQSDEEEGCLSEGDDDRPPKSHAMLGEELAQSLNEPKTDLMVGVVDVVGVEMALELFKRTRHIESGGGMMIKNNERRRTPGGVYLHLLREMSSNPNTKEETSAKIKAFFAQSNQHQAHNKNANKKRKFQLMKGSRGDFAAELQSFKKFSQHSRKQKERKDRKKQEKEAATAALHNNADCEMEQDGGGSVAVAGSGDLKPLPDILSCISQRVDSTSPSSSANIRTSRDSNLSGVSTGGGSATSARRSSGKNFLGPDVFDEPPPDAPPNSVEPVRSVNHYDDDFLSTAADTEDIELF